MPNAGKFWGLANTGGTNGECASPSSNVGTGTQTCNGDGNGMIGNLVPERYERLRYWQHLANSGLIEGSFIGTSIGANDGNVVAGSNVPRMRIGNNICKSVVVGDAAWGFFPAHYGKQLLSMGGQTTNRACAAPFLASEEAWNLDTKMDDGRPGLGRVGSLPNTEVPKCSSTDVEATAEYLVKETGLNCPIGIRLN